MARPDRITVTVTQGKRRLTTRAPLHGIDRIVIVVNDQFTNAPNTTQIASGAGRSSAAGSNAAINSPLTSQQQSVGAGGKAKNLSSKNPPPTSPYLSAQYPSPKQHLSKEVVMVINRQVVKVPRRSQNASATQVASGGGTFSTGGTNAAIESPKTKQQHAVGGGSGSRAVNKNSGSLPRKSSRRHKKRHRSSRTSIK